MKTISTNAGLKVKTSIKAGGGSMNHNRARLAVKTGLKAGGGAKCNHSARVIGIR